MNRSGSFLFKCTIHLSQQSFQHIQGLKGAEKPHSLMAELSSPRVCCSVQLCHSESWGRGGDLAGRQALGPPSCHRSHASPGAYIPAETHSHSKGPLGKWKTKGNSDKPQVSKPHSRCVLSDNAATFLFSTFHLIRLELTYFEYQEKQNSCSLVSPKRK